MDDLNAQTANEIFWGSVLGEVKSIMGDDNATESGADTNFGAGGGDGGPDHPGSARSDDGAQSGDGEGNTKRSDSKNDIEIGANDYANTLQDYYESKKGGTYHISTWRFYDMVGAAWDKQAIEFEKAKYNPETGIYTVPVNFYKTDYWASFGRATLKYRILDDNFKNPMNKIDFIGFSDKWDLDPKPWGIRSISTEIITRWYNITLNGSNFGISYP